MKILHLADLHLGVENYSSGINPETGLSWRLHDFLDAFDEVVAYAIGGGIDVVIFCGDAYKSREPSQTHQREFARRVWKLASAGICVFLLIGNHDLPNAIGRATALEIFRTLEIENVTVANKLGTYRIQTKSGSLQVVGLPWARRNALLSRDEAKDLSVDEVNQRMESILAEGINREATALDPSLPAVLAAHACVSGAALGSERGMIMGHDYTLLYSNVSSPAFDYVALGHMHRAQVLGEDPPVVYSGSLQRIDFGEEEDEKGFFIVDIDSDRSVSFNFQPVKARRFLTIRVEIDGQEMEPTQAVLRAVAAEDITDAIVRLQISTPEQQAGQISETDLRRALKDAHVIAAISRDVPREHRLRMPASSVEGLEPIQALKSYFDAIKPEVSLKSLLEYGQRLISEAEDTADIRET